MSATSTENDGDSATTIATLNVDVIGTGGEPVITAGLGSVRVPLARARIVDGAGQILNSTTFGGETMFDAVKPDVYTASANGVSVHVIASVLDPRDADVNLTRFDGSQHGVIRPAGFSRVEPWMALVAIALIFILVEWVAWTRRFAL